MPGFPNRRLIFKTQKLPAGMFLIKSCNQTFMTHFCFYKLFLVTENKNTEYLTPYTNNDYTNVIDYIKITSNLTQNR